MANILIYSTKNCPFCVRAKSLLEAKGVSFDEIFIDEQPEKRIEMKEKSGRQTVPQIFINDKHIGGFDDLYSLDVAGDLDPLLE